MAIPAFEGGVMKAGQRMRAGNYFREAKVRRTGQGDRYGLGRQIDRSKPLPQVFMNTSKLVRLSAIDNRLDSLIQFRDWRDTTEDVAAGGALTAGGYGGYKLHKAIRASGGYREAGQQLGIGYGLGKAGGADVPLGTAWKGLRKGFKGSPGASVGSALGILRSKLHLESKEKPVQFGTPAPISPWGGSTGHESKIDQVEFPSGPAPLTMLQMPLPALMRYLNRPGQLQQAFSRKKERLVQLSAKLDEINA